MYAHNAIYFLDAVEVQTYVKKQAHYSQREWEATEKRDKCAYVFNTFAHAWAKGLHQVFNPTYYK